MEHRSASVAFSDYREMPYQAIGRLLESVKVVLLADREFIHAELMQAATIQLGWHYRIRLRSTTWIWRAGKGWCQLKTALECGWQLIHQVRFIGNHDPDPAMASRKQHDKRRYRLEFIIQTDNGSLD